MNTSSTSTASTPKARAQDSKLFIWTIGPGDNLGNLSVTAPGEAISGETGQVSISWDGLERQTHLGTVTHSDGEDVLEVTLIEIEN